MANTHVNQRVQKHRDALRTAGLRPVQLWVPDTRRPGFEEECQRQCKLVAKADEAEISTEPLMEDALENMDGWTA